MPSSMPSASEHRLETRSPRSRGPVEAVRDRNPPTAWKRCPGPRRTPFVYLLDVSKWVGFRLLTEPIAWFWLLICSTLWPGILVFSPFSVNLGSEDAARLVHEAALLAALGGVTLALYSLGESEWIFRRAAPRRRYLARAVGLFTGGAMGITASLLLPLSMATRFELAWGDILAGLAMTLAHLVGGGMLLLSLPIGQFRRSILLPLSAWLLPSLVDPQAPTGKWVATLFRADREFESLRDQNLGELGASLAPIVVLWLVAALLDGAQTPAPSPRI